MILNTNKTLLTSYKKYRISPYFSLYVRKTNQLAMPVERIPK